MPVIELKTEEEFKQAITRKDDTLVVVDFSAVWCGPCKRMAPAYTKMSDEFTNSYFYSLDVDEVGAVSQKLGIISIPCFKLFKNGEEVSEMLGANEPKLYQLIKDHENKKLDGDESKAVGDESKAVVDESKAVEDESKAVVDESKAVVDESKAVVDESKAVVDESKAE